MSSPIQRLRRSARGAPGGLVPLLLAGALVVGATEPEPRLYSARVAVGYGEPPGPDSLSRALETSLVRSLHHEKCLAAVHTTEEGNADLVLQVVLDAFEDREEFESSIAERNSPRSDPVEQATRVVAGVAADVRFELRTLPQNTVVRSRRFHHENSYRPSWDEDPREEARRRFVESLEREARTFTCKGGPRKLARDIERANTASR